MHGCREAELVLAGGHLAIDQKLVSRREPLGLMTMLSVLRSRCTYPRLLCMMSMIYKIWNMYSLTKLMSYEIGASGAASRSLIPTPASVAPAAPGLFVSKSDSLGTDALWSKSSRARTSSFCDL